MGRGVPSHVWRGRAGWVVSCDCEGMVRLAMKRGLYSVKKARERERRGRERERERVNDCLVEINL